MQYRQVVVLAVKLEVIFVIHTVWRIVYRRHALLNLCGEGLLRVKSAYLATPLLAVSGFNSMLCFNAKGVPCLNWDVTRSFSPSRAPLSEHSGIRTVCHSTLHEKHDSVVNMYAGEELPSPL